MRVKIGDEWIDASQQWLAVQFTAEELECVKQLDHESSSMSFASGAVEDDADLLEWLREGR